MNMEFYNQKEFNMIIDNIDALEKIKQLPDNSQDIIFGDFPYALGSTVYIDKNDGKPKYKYAKDFQNKWDMPDYNFWEKFFIECNRVLKHGGRVLCFGIDRQLMLFNYYAVAAGLETQQSLYWYYLSNFPKSVDLSKQIDKKLGKDREIVGTIKNWAVMQGG
jgi:site-specific DNA-methyltransferase (adenine-specific)